MEINSKACRSLSETYGSLSLVSAYGKLEEKLQLERLQELTKGERQCRFRALILDFKAGKDDLFISLDIKGASDKDGEETLVQPCRRRSSMNLLKGHPVGL